MQKVLIIIHAAPYGSERCLSGLRVAAALAAMSRCNWLGGGSVRCAHMLRVSRALGKVMAGGGGSGL